MNETDKLIEEQLKTLPPNLGRAINAVPWKALAQEVGKANALDAEQIMALEQETMFILYAFENPRDYVSNIIRETGVSQETAEVIAESVTDKIFNPILEKSERQENAPAPKVISVKAPEVVSTNLPMIEPPSAQGSGGAKEGEVAHEVPHLEQPTTTPVSPQIKSEQAKVPLPDYRYESGKDPYREPLS